MGLYQVQLKQSQKTATVAATLLPIGQSSPADQQCKHSKQHTESTGCDRQSLMHDQAGVAKA